MAADGTSASCWIHPAHQRQQRQEQGEVGGVHSWQEGREPVRQKGAVAKKAPAKKAKPVREEDAAKKAAPKKKAAAKKACWEGTDMPAGGYQKPEKPAMVWDRKFSQKDRRPTRHPACAFAT